MKQPSRVHGADERSKLAVPSGRDERWTFVDPETGREVTVSRQNYYHARQQAMIDLGSERVDLVERKADPVVELFAAGAKVFFSVDAAFAYFTECALATVERTSRLSRRDRQRLASIAEDMVNVCRQYSIGTHQGLPRLTRRLG